MGTPAKGVEGEHTPKTPDEGSAAGSMPRGTLKRARSSSSHSSVWMLKSRVRDALETSVAWTAAAVVEEGGASPPSPPPVSRQRRKVSMVPKRASPASASARRPGTFSRAQASLEALK
jgi:hypothetical protein